MVQRSFFPLLIVAAALFVASGAAAQAARFKHIVLVIQENRTPDNLFGSNPRFEPGIDVAKQGTNSLGQTIPLVANPMVQCWDIGHGHGDFEAMYTEGADKEHAGSTVAGCVVPPDPQFKFVDNSTGEVQPYFDIASNYGFANRMFQTNQGPSFPAHQFLFTGTSQPTTDSPLFVSSNTSNKNEASGCISPPDQTVTLIDGYGSETSNAPIFPCFEHPALSDLLDKAALSWHYYTPQPTGIWNAPNAINHICVPAEVHGALKCTGPDWANGDVVQKEPSQVLTDISGCNLAAVSWVIPTAEESDHAGVTDGSGPQWVASVVNAVGEQPTCASGENYWKDTAIVITWDDWGGWYDHVSPPINNVQPASPPKWGDGYTYGFRVPLMVVSAYTPSHYVDNHEHDFGSILYFIESNFALGFIGPGDTIYSNYADYQSAVYDDRLRTFFTLEQPRKFVPIATTMTPRDFINQPPSTLPVDNE